MKKFWRLTALLLLLGLVAGACGGSEDAGAGSGDKAATTTSAADGASGDSDGTPLEAANLALVAYSTPQKAYEQITEAFAKTTQGKDITFTKSFGASGDQSRAVEGGLEADVVAFSLEPDMNRLVKKDIVDASWNTDADAGLITKSVVVLVVRKGNPKKVKGWDDLIKDDIEVISANPFTSGGARWNVMAAYGQVIKGGGTEAQGIDYLKKLFKNVPVQDDSARKSLQTFTSGKGDVLLAYENEAIFAQQEGAPIDYVVPDDTILIENPVAVTKTSKHPTQAKAFLEYLHGQAAQKIFADNGYRPVLDGVKTKNEFPEPKDLFTIKDFGGWTDVTKKFFDPTGSIMKDVEQSIGVSVG